MKQGHPPQGHAGETPSTPGRVDPWLRDHAARTCIAVLNWNRSADLIRLLESLYAAFPDGFADQLALVVVDNGSTDDSVAQVERQFPGVQLICNPVNLGGSGGFNTAIRHALDHGFEFVWLLDNDVVVRPGALEPLLKTMLSDPKIAVVGSKILHAQDPEVICEAGADIDAVTTRTRPRLWNQLNKDQQGALDVDYVAACSLLARLDAVRQVGLLDEAYFLLWDDMDWGVRFRRAGFRVAASLASVVVHPGFSERRIAPAFLYYAARNHLYFIHRNYRGLRRLFHLATAVGVHRSHERLLAAEGRLRPLADASRRGISDFFSQRMGKYEGVAGIEAGQEAFDAGREGLRLAGRAVLFVDEPVDVATVAASAFESEGIEMTLVGAADRGVLFRGFDYVAYGGGLVGFFRYLSMLRHKRIDFIFRFAGARRGKQHFLTDQVIIDRDCTVLGVIHRSYPMVAWIWLRDAYLRLSGLSSGTVEGLIRSRWLPRDAAE